MKQFCLCLLFALICHQAANVSCFRIYRPRQEILNIVASNGEGIEERLYADSCRTNTGDSSLCELAHDGEIIQELTQCLASDASSDEPYWIAKLEFPSYVSRVVIHTVVMPNKRQNSGLIDFSLLISQTECYRHASTEIFTSKSFPCDVFGDEIEIKSYVKEALLALCEVELFGKTVAFEGLDSTGMEIDFASCDQSSTHGEQRCNYAIDRNFGQREGASKKFCARTRDDESYPWLAVYFQTPALVTHAKVFSQLDACCVKDLSNLEVFINDALCGTHQSDNIPASGLVFRCSKFGSLLQIKSKSNTKARLTICQVQVFGNQMVIQPDKVFNYTGCYKDIATDPDLDTQVSATWMSPRKCHRICKRINKLYFGLQNGQVCFCGITVGRHGKAEDPKASCSMPCKDDAAIMCGGLGYNSVYEIF